MASSYSRSPLSLLVKSKTWSRDSHGLYDYESRNVATHHLEISSECQIVRSESNVGVASADLAHPGNPLLSVEPRNGQYHVSAALPEQLWLVVRHMHSEDGSGCQLREGDTLKLGRVELRVRELRGLEDSDSAALTQESSEEEPEVPSERDIGQCRVCFGEENDEDNPLVTPCACSGSVKYIHVACLQQWLDSRKVMRESENAINYHWRTMGCELCKDPYPLTISSMGKNFPLVQKEEIPRPYVVLESVNRANGVYVFSLLNSYTVKLGRGHDSDVRVSDISVSRVHASIHFKQGKFYFEDNQSKFGSLLLVKGALALQPQQEQSIQVGRSVFSLAVGPHSE